jgi:hypothetical protein
MHTCNHCFFVITKAPVIDETSAQTLARTSRIRQHKGNLNTKELMAQTQTIAEEVNTKTKVVFLVG